VDALTAGMFSSPSALQAALSSAGVVGITVEAIQTAPMSVSLLSQPPSVSPSPPPSASPSPPTLSSLTEAERISAELSTTADNARLASLLIDDNLVRWTRTKAGVNNWASVRVAAGTSVGYVAVHNWVGSADNRAKLGDFEIWVGRAAGDTDTANGAVKCGESSYEASKTEDEPYVLWCGEASSGWSDSDGGEFITLKQVGESRELRLTELEVYEAPDKPSS